LGEATGSKPRHAVKAGATFSLPGSVVMTPDLESVRGTIVIVAAMHDWYGPLERPLTLHVDGRIRRIAEEGPDVALLDRALRRAGGGDYGHVIHFSYGLHPAARYRGDCFVEDIRAIGANAIGFGVPWWKPGGGENHPDGLLLRQNLWVEGQQIIKSGLVIAPDRAAKASQAAIASAAPG
jgi:2,5-dihydroxypyridine 5,6-dioxygenase